MARARLHPFERSVLETARGHGLLRPDDHVLVALSGGPDSTALLLALAALCADARISAVSACHVDHGLRPDSALDGAFCAELCAAVGVPLERVIVEVSRRGGVQASARRERYRALMRVADARGATRVATAHTRSDQSETVVHRLLRGAGARGLAAIPVRRGRIVRPLLDRSRAEVLAYLADRDVAPRDDPSNRSPRYLRNRIRHEVLPQLEALVPGVERRLARTAELLRDDDRALERLARSIGRVSDTAVSVQALRAAPVALRRRVVRQLWRAATGTRRGLEADHVEAILRLLRRTGPGSLDLPSGTRAVLAYGVLDVRPRAREACAAAAFAPVVVEHDGTYTLPDRGVIEVRWSAPAPAPWPLEVRTRRPGDRFHPAGGRGGKKLKAWLIDRKVPRDLRDGLVVVADRTGEVLCVPELGVTAEGAAGLSVSLQYCKRGVGLL